MICGTVLFQRKKDLNGAAAALTKALQFDKNNTDARIKLVRYKRPTEQVDDAITTYQQGLKDNPQEKAAYYVLLGQLFQPDGIGMGAAEAYQKALAIKPENPLASNGSRFGACCNLVQPRRRALSGANRSDAACQIHPASRIRWLEFYY